MTTKKQWDGAQALVKCLEHAGVEYMFGIPGGVTIPIFDALVTTGTKIKFILTRHEQGACHMADGYARATGRPAVVCATSGPGATNTITGIMTAHMDSVPMIIVSGQVVTTMLGKDAFQEADMFGISMPIVKHSYLVKNPNDVPRVVKEAFHVATTGRPGPVLIDMPKNISASHCMADLDQPMDLPGYHPYPEKMDMHAIERIAHALNKSRRPVLLVGHGAVISGAGNAIRELAEKLHAPVTNTLLGKGAFPESHPLSLGMLGMHGTVYANKAVIECDLIMSIGSRFDDRISAQPDKFCTQATKIHIDVDPSEIGKMIKPDIVCIGDAKGIVEELVKRAVCLDTKEWMAHLDDYKKKYPLHYGKQGGLKVQHIVDELYNLTGGKATVVTDVGQHQMWTAQFYRVNKQRGWLSSGGAGTMGYGFPAAIGAQFGKPKDLVVSISGDGGFQMTMCELATACNHKLPIKAIVMNNRYLGMVRQWQELFYDDRKSGVNLEGNPDFAEIADAYGALGLHLKRPADVQKILKRALEYNDGPCIIDAEVIKEDNVFPMVPAGRVLEDMIIDPPKKNKQEKPAAKR